MKLELGVPGAGTTVTVDLGDEPRDEKAVAVLVEEAVGYLKVAGETWRKWSLAHETAEEKETRLIMEKNRMLNKQAVERQNLELEQMLAGQTEGIGKIGRGA